MQAIFSKYFQAKLLGLSHAHRDCGIRPAGRKLSAHGQSAVVTEAACASFRRCRHFHCRLRAKVVDAMRIFLSSLNVASGSHSIQGTHLLRERNARLEIRCSIWPSYGRSRQEFRYNYARRNDNRVTCGGGQPSAIDFFCGYVPTEVPILADLKA